MGREIKRVPLDFDWPLKKRWEGYLNPHYKPCPEEGKTCFGGETAAGRWMDAVARLLAILGEEAAYAPHAETNRERRIYPHPYLESWEQAPRQSIPHAESVRLQGIEAPAERLKALGASVRAHPAKLLPLTPELQEVVEGLSGAPIDPLGGALVAYRIRSKLLRAAGIKRKTFGVCPVCHGENLDPSVAEAYNAWTRTEPPRGDGWQLWETVSEGSPVSPVLPTQQAFIDWLASPTGGDFDRTAAENFVNGPGWAPSAVIADGKLYKSVDSCGIPRP